jgi:predicted CXXCH cytochrome family protein
MPHRSLIAAGAAVLALAQAGPDGPRILRPADGAVLPPGPLTVIARGAAPLKLDGQALTVRAAAESVVVAAITPSGGRHELSLRDHKVRFFVGPGAPAEFRPYQVHPPAETACNTCHVIRDGVWEFRGAESSCFGCHDAKKFPAGHTHNAEVLSECGLCHEPHGSAEKFHLKLRRETACKQCHG